MLAQPFKDESIILFQNRRGSAPSTMSDLWSCGRCTRCDISLTYHKGPNQLKCHYCGYQTPPVMKCKWRPKCAHKGFGTEQIAEEAAALFPKATVKRMDSILRGKHAFGDLIRSVEQGGRYPCRYTNGHQGMDFDRVGLVGIMSADNLLSYPVSGQRTCIPTH